MLKPQEVSTHVFTKALFRGYNMAAVDEFLDSVAEDYSTIYQENTTLKSKLKAMADKVEEYRATEEAMRSALLAAQRTAEGIIQDAEARRDEILTHASDEALARRDDCRREVAELEERMRLARTEMARFIASGRELCSQELKFLEQLPQMEVNVTLEDDDSAAPDAESGKDRKAPSESEKTREAPRDGAKTSAQDDAPSEKADPVVTVKREAVPPRLDALKFGQSLKKD